MCPAFIRVLLQFPTTVQTTVSYLLRSFMRFIYVRGEERVKAWGSQGGTRVDVDQYVLLLNRAAHEILDIVQGKDRLESLPMDTANRLLSDSLRVSA